MRQVTLKKEESQTISVGLGGKTYTFRIYHFRTLMYIDIRRGKEYLVTGKRIMSNEWIIPSYKSNYDGNVRFETYTPDKDSYVWYEGFNTKFRFVVYTADEIEGMG